MRGLGLVTAMSVSAVLVSATWLAGCGSSEPAAPSQSAEPSSPPVLTETSTPASTPSAQAGGPRCHTRQLAAHLGTRTSLESESDQVVVPLVYTNISKRACLLRGVPGLDLRGPNDPNGPVYSLRRTDKGGALTLAPGASASARVVVLPYSDGSLGSDGSKRWTPTQLVTIPPGETAPLTVAWPADLSVLRQDAATHPGSWVESFTANRS